MSQHRGFQQVPQDVALLRRLVPTLAGFQPGTSRTPNVHLTTRPYRPSVVDVFDVAIVDAVYAIPYGSVDRFVGAFGGCGGSKDKHVKVKE